MTRMVQPLTIRYLEKTKLMVNGSPQQNLFGRRRIINLSGEQLSLPGNLKLPLRDGKNLKLLGRHGNHPKKTYRGKQKQLP